MIEKTREKERQSDGIRYIERKRECFRGRAKYF